MAANDTTHLDGSLALNPAGSASIAAPLRARRRMRIDELHVGATGGRIALASLLLGAVVLVAFASSQQSILVPRSYLSFPHWESGPLHFIFRGLTNDYNGLDIGFSLFVPAMTIAYGAAILAVRTFTIRQIVTVIVALHMILLLVAPVQLTDLFNYLGYARLGAVHHLNPYTHGISAEMHDPVYRFTTWHNLKSPYGPLFTAITYPIALLPLPVAYWILKVMTVLLSFSFLALVYRGARLLGRDPRFALVFVALNPIYLIYEIGGFHNDFFMLIPSLAAVLLLMQRRDRSAGAILMLAVAVKFTAVLLLPFLLIAARPAERRLKVLSGVMLGAVPLIAMSIALFGFTIPNLSDQSTLLTDLSVPNLAGIVLGVGGGTPGLLRVANVLLVLVVIYLLRRQRDWISGAGWATLALIASLAWLVPWYILWVLPLAALGTSVRLRRASVAFTIFLVLSFLPETGIQLINHGLNPMGSSVGQASKALQRHLAGS